MIIYKKKDVEKNVEMQRHLRSFVKLFRISITLILSLFVIGLSNSSAQNRGPVIANNIMGGAGAGSAVGLAAGVMTYGMNGHREPKVLLTSTVYGFLGGAIAGTGVGVYEISTGKGDTGFTVSEYVLGGTGIGAVLGIVVAIIPFTDNGSLDNFTIGSGIGGLIGATFGLGFAFIDINSTSPEGDVLLSGEIGLYPEVVQLPSLDSDSEFICREPMISCRLVQMRF